MDVVEDNIKMGLAVTIYGYEDGMTSSAFTYKGEESNIMLREVRSEKFIVFTSYHILTLIVLMWRIG